GKQPGQRRGAIGNVLSQRQSGDLVVDAHASRLLSGQDDRDLSDGGYWREKDRLGPDSTRVRHGQPWYHPNRAEATVDISSERYRSSHGDGDERDSHACADRDRGHLGSLEDVSRRRGVAGSRDRDPRAHREGRIVPGPAR